MKENKKDKKDKKDKKAEKIQKDENKWKKYFIGMSALSGVLLIRVAVLAAQPPKVEYIYKVISVQ